jgi:hypothetical protein
MLSQDRSFVCDRIHGVGSEGHADHARLIFFILILFQKSPKCQSIKTRRLAECTTQVLVCKFDARLESECGIRLSA